MKGDIITHLTPENIAEICRREPRFKKTLKGYNGPVVSFESDGFGPMLLPDNERIIETVSMAWPMVVFGHMGDNPFNRAVAVEISKRLAGKIYSVKNLAQLVEN